MAPPHVNPLHPLPTCSKPDRGKLCARFYWRPR